MIIKIILIGAKKSGGILGMVCNASSIRVLERHKGIVKNEAATIFDLSG